jgi:hypothetical protein
MRFLCVDLSCSFNQPNTKNHIYNKNRRSARSDGFADFTRVKSLLRSGFVENRNLELDDNAMTKINLGLIFTNRLERFVEFELRTLKLDATVRLNRGEKIRRADRTVKLNTINGGSRNGELEFFELPGDFESGLLLFGGAGCALGLELFETALRGFSRDSGETLGEKEVARVTRSDIYNLSSLAELLHVIHEHDFDLHRFMLLSLGHEAHVTSALNALANLTLLLGCDTRDASRKNLAVVSDVILKRLDVVNVDLIVRTERRTLPRGEFFASRAI